jgi:hypothetical protein
LTATHPSSADESRAALSPAPPPRPDTCRILPAYEDYGLK